MLTRWLQVLFMVLPLPALGNPDSDQIMKEVVDPAICQGTSLSKDGFLEMLYPLAFAKLSGGFFERSRLRIDDVYGRWRPSESTWHTPGGLEMRVKDGKASVLLQKGHHVLLPLLLCDPFNDDNLCMSFGSEPEFDLTLIEEVKINSACLWIKMTNTDNTKQGFFYSDYSPREE